MTDNNLKSETTQGMKVPVQDEQLKPEGVSIAPPPPTDWPDVNVYNVKGMHVKQRNSDPVIIYATYPGQVQAIHGAVQIYPVHFGMTKPMFQSSWIARQWSENGRFDDCQDYDLVPACGDKMPEPPYFPMEPKPEDPPK